LGWKIKQVITNYAREYNKASKNELNTIDDEFAQKLSENKIMSDIDIVIGEILKMMELLLEFLNGHNLQIRTQRN